MYAILCLLYLILKMMILNLIGTVAKDFSLNL